PQGAYARERAVRGRANAGRAGGAQQSDGRAGARLCRRGAAAKGRGRRDEHSGRQEGPVRQAVPPESRMIFGFGRRRSSAPVARERLRILLEYERAAAGKRDLVLVLREEILAVIGRHVRIEPEKVTVNVDRGTTVSTLEIDIEIPNVEAWLASA